MADNNDRTHDIDELRHHLFKTLEDLRDEESPMDIDRANAIKNVANEIINSAKVDLKYLELTGKDKTFFIERPRQTSADPRRQRPLASISQGKK